MFFIFPPHTLSCCAWKQVTSYKLTGKLLPGGEMRGTNSHSTSMLLSALSTPSHWVCALWLKNWEYSSSLDYDRGSSSTIANCSSRLANNLVSVPLKLFLGKTARCTILLLISFLILFPADLYNCIAMKSRFVLRVLCDNCALRNILETLCTFYYQRTNVRPR